MGKGWWEKEGRLFDEGKGGGGRAKEVVARGGVFFFLFFFPDLLSPLSLFPSFSLLQEVAWSRGEEFEEELKGASPAAPVSLLSLVLSRRTRARERESSKGTQSRVFFLSFFQNSFPFFAPRPPLRLLKKCRPTAPLLTSSRRSSSAWPVARRSAARSGRRGW